MKTYCQLETVGVQALAVCIFTMAGEIAAAQAPETTNPGPRVILSSGSVSAGGSTMVREIDDAQLGIRWRLMRDPKDAGGPGVWVSAATRENRLGTNAGAQADDQGWAPVLRAGDRVVVEEHTAVADAHLEAVALGPAGAGTTFAVRLKIGGRIVHAVALGPGRAALAPEGRQ
jgi:hypothetical protein